MVKYECVYCGKVHKDGSPILNKHIHDYYKMGGTIPLSSWKKIDEPQKNKDIIGRMSK